MTIRYTHAESGGGFASANALEGRRGLVEPPQARRMVHLVVNTVRFQGNRWRYDVLTLPLDVAVKLKELMARTEKAKEALGREISRDFPEIRNFGTMDSEKYERYVKLEHSLMGEVRRETRLFWQNHAEEIEQHYFAAPPMMHKKLDILPAGEVRAARIPELVDYSS